MKSFPRPWYLAKWRKPVCRRLRKEAEGLLTGASVLMEEATRRELGYLKVRRGMGKVDRGEWGKRLLREARVRRVGDVRGTEMVAVMAILQLRMAVDTSICHCHRLGLTLSHTVKR